MCGTVPRRCFRCARSDEKLLAAKFRLKKAIDEIEDVTKAIQNIRGNHKFPHRIFEIYPSLDSRQFDCCEVRPLSEWVFNELVAEMEQRDKDFSYKFYRSLQATNDASAFRGRVWERQVHKYFRSIADPTTFCAHSLDNRANSINFSLSNAVQQKDFGTIAAFRGELLSCVRGRKPCYLKPISRTFATVDSVIYLPGFNQPGLQPVLNCQMTDSWTHLISAKGFATIQSSLKPSITDLNELRPSTTQKWILLFIVPAPTGSAFVKQNYKEQEGKRIWGPKVAQYVLELDPGEVWKA